MIEHRSGAVVMRVEGVGARELFDGEVGGHRWQRIPPTEKRGRVHSSTITVAVLGELAETRVELPANELAWSTCRASGSGGQHLQKTDSAVQLTHIPTGTSVRIEGQRSQHQNRALALQTLQARLAKQATDQAAAARAAQRRAQVGSGMRADKRRTVREQDDAVVDHETGRTWRYREYRRGNW